MAKTIEQINEKIKKKKAVVVTAEEVINIASSRGIRDTARYVDVVTTGTFGPMCSSGAYFNIGHSSPRIKLGGGEVFLNGVPAYAGLAAADIFLGAAALAKDDPLNRVYPGEFKYGGGYVIQELVAGKDIKLEATAHGTDCYPRKSLETWINIRDLNEAVLFNPRNSYQNYDVAVNLSKDRTIYTYMGILYPDLGNANYCSAGQLSPLLNDPFYKTIGIGTKIFLGGGTGFVAWNGTQHNPAVERTDKGVPKTGGGTLALIGDLKKMKPEWRVGTSFIGYGATLTVGIGIPIPILSEKILKFTTIRDEEIFTQIVDYSKDYPKRINRSLGEVSYDELRSGRIKLRGKEVPTGAFSSYMKAREIAQTLKDWITKGKFTLTEPVQPIPSVESGVIFKPLKQRQIK